MMKQHFLFIISAIILLSSCDGNFNKQTTRFWIEDTTLNMEGDINCQTPKQLRNILIKNKNLKTVIMHDVPGTIDSECALEAGIMIHNSKLNTHLLSTSIISSGGTDFFLGGIKRTAVKGARIGVHSWGDEGEFEGRDLRKDHKAHEMFLNYYRQINIPEDFYWFTLESASVDDMYWMKENELLKYKIITERLRAYPKNN